MARGEILLGAEEVAWREALGEQGFAHVGDDLRGQRGRAPEYDERRRASGGRAGRRGGGKPLHATSRAKGDKDDIFCDPRVKWPFLHPPARGWVKKESRVLRGAWACNSQAP